MTELNKPHPPRERRRGNDWLIRLMAIGSVTGWGLFVAAMAVFHFARPQLETGFSRFLHIQLRQNWDKSLLHWLLILLGLCVVLTVITLIIRQRRTRRRTDGLWLNLFLLGIGACASLIFIWLKFNF